MIGDPVALTVRRNIKRPPTALLKHFQGAPTGFVTDAFNGKGCLSYLIKPLTPEMYVCGSAITCQAGHGDNLAIMAALDYVKKGDVIVIAGNGDTSGSKIGDLWAFWAKKQGVAGIVVDGLVRDVIGILKVGIPVFARGMSPNSTFKNGPGEINAVVSCGGITITPGDIIVGDRDGVVAVPFAEAEQVVAQLKLVKKNEAEAEAKVKRGAEFKFWDRAAMEKSGTLRYLD